MSLTAMLHRRSTVLIIISICTVLIIISICVDQDTYNSYDYYVRQHRLAHINPKNFKGTSLTEWIDDIDVLIHQQGITTILDYGCGKAQCWPDHWRHIITGFDPAVDQFSHKPHDQFDLVLCIDVLEHVPEQCVEWVLSDIFNYARKWTFFDISCVPAGTRLPDGSNKHLCVRDPEWWDLKLSPYKGRYTVHYLTGQ